MCFLVGGEVELREAELRILVMDLTALRFSVFGILLLESGSVFLDLTVALLHCILRGLCPKLRLFTLRVMVVIMVPFKSACYDDSNGG